MKTHVFRKPDASNSRRIFAFSADRRYATSFFKLNITFFFKRLSFSLPAMIVMMCSLFVNANSAYAQDPILPSANIGFSNVYDGASGKPGWYYEGYVQDITTKNVRDASGNKTPSGLKINSIVSLNQLIYLTPIKVLSGNLGFTVLLPFVQISSSNLTGSVPSVNPGVIGDLIEENAIQWNDKKLFGKDFAHRFVLSVVLPTGAYDSRYNINPSSHLYAFGVYHAFTLFLDKEISLSLRNQLNYNGHIIGQQAKPGSYYNANYSVDYSIIPSIKIEAVGYYLHQIQRDSYAGNHSYYLDQYGIDNTKESVFAFGPGLAYFAPNGILIEAKIFFETAAKNRLEGNRPTLRIAIPLSK